MGGIGGWNRPSYSLLSPEGPVELNEKMLNIMGYTVTHSVGPALDVRPDH